MNKDITPRNDKGQLHGYTYFYTLDDNLYAKGNYINGISNGLWIFYTDINNKKLIYII